MSVDVAILGAGPGGLAVAKALQDVGVAPQIFEASDNIGGQWYVSAEHSGIWKDMHTNTSRATTMFSDLLHEPDTGMFPRATDISDYLHSYADMFNLVQYIRFKHRVVGVEQSGGAFRLKVDADGELKEYSAAKLVVATGRYNRAEMPFIEGLESFTGSAIHAFDFDDPARFSGQTLSPEEASAGLAEQVVALHGNPADHGGMAPSQNMMEAGIGQCQDYLALVAEGRIRCQGMPTSVSGGEVTFPDGTTETFDTIIAGTGYPLKLDFLSEELLNKLNADQANLDLFAYTFAPDVPDLALMGQFPMVGPYFPVLELQARLAALVFSDRLTLPSHPEMQAPAKAFHDMMSAGAPLTYHDVVTELARTANVEPELGDRPWLAAELVFGPIIPSHFRLSGPGAWQDPEARLLEALADIDRKPAAPADDQLGLLTMLANTEMPWSGVAEALNAFEQLD